MLLVVDLLIVLESTDFLQFFREFTYVNIRRIARNFLKEWPLLSKFKEYRSKKQFSKLNQKIYLLAALKALKDI